MDEKTIKSEKELYGADAKRAMAKRPGELCIWGEDLIGRKLIVYPKKLKHVEGFGEIKERLKPCSLILIDPNERNAVHFTSATLDAVNGNVYMAAGCFNSCWCRLKKSVETGVALARARGDGTIEQPEDILVLDQLRTAWVNPVLADGVIQYETREMSEAERYVTSRKQGLLDQPRMIFFYDREGGCVHDRDCVMVKRIAPERFEAASQMPDRELCPQCMRRLCLRIACYPNTKQIGIIDRILKRHRMPFCKIRHYVMEAGMRFHATSLEELLVTCAEDTWDITGVDGNRPKLWHNNYVKTGETERYITNGFHQQNTDHPPLDVLLTRIENYSYDKHLETERARAGKADGVGHKSR